MEHLLTESEVVVFDVILKYLQNNQVLYSQQLPKMDSHHYSQHKDVKNNDYKYYLKRLEYYDVLKITTDGYNYIISPNPLSKNFYDNGGFRSLYEKQQKELIETKKIEEIKLSNLFLENEEKRFRVKRQKTLYILTIIGSAVTVIGLIIAVIKIFLEK